MPPDEPAHEIGATGGETLRHPADRGETDGRGAFDDLAERASFLASSPVFFVLCGVVVAVWLAGLALGASDRFVAACAGVMSAVTLILVALMKNAELRAERAIQRKLDAIACALLEQQRGDRVSSTRELEDTIGVHEQI